MYVTMLSNTTRKKNKMEDDKMVKKMKGLEGCCDAGWMGTKKLKMGGLLFLLGLILYAKEVGIIPYAGSIWTLAMMVVGIVLLVKGIIMRYS